LVLLNSVYRKTQELADYNGDIDFEQSEKVKVSKNNFKLRKYIVDENNIVEDALKIEQLIEGCEKRHVFLKQSSTGFSDLGTFS
jgi:hypothetical protein